MTTTAQAASRLNATLDGIWRMGDRDEASIKHIGHSLAAIMAGGSWSDGVDYEFPWGLSSTFYAGEWHDWPQATIDQHVKRLAAKWAKVEAMREALGAEQFAAAVAASKFTGYPERYLASDYGSANA